MMNRLSTWPLPFRILNTSRDLDEMFNRFLGDWEQGRIPRPEAPAVYVPQIANSSTSGRAEGLFMNRPRRSKSYLNNLS